MSFRTSAPLLALLVIAVGAQTSDGDELNVLTTRYMLVVWGGIATVFVAYELCTQTGRFFRKIACFNNDTQRYFATPNRFVGCLKENLLDAPLFRKRHHREFRLSSAINVGTLPSRLHSLFLVVFVGLNAAFVVWGLDWRLATSPVLAERAGVWAPLFRRAGVLATLNMVPLFVFAGRNNPLLHLTPISFDTFNLFHRWLGRIAVGAALIHAIFWVVLRIERATTPAMGWASVKQTYADRNPTIVTGTIAVVAFVAISIQAASPLRHAFYEFFLHFHQALVVLAVVGLWYHLLDITLSRQALVAAVAIWVAERTTRVVRIAYRNWGAGGTKAMVEILPGDALRVTVQLARPWLFTPGQHAYLYLPRVGWWTAHPFSLAWSDDSISGADESGDKDVMLTSEDEVLGMRKRSISMIIRRRTGFTHKLYVHAEKMGGGKFTTSALLEGPYGNESFASYGSVLLFAAGIGITHQVPHVRDLVVGYNNGTVATRKITLVWITQSPEHLEWIRPWMTQILNMPKRRDCLKIVLFVTRPRSTKEVRSPSASVLMFPGKPNVEALVDSEVETRIGSLCVSVCGTGSLADDVRRASRKWMCVANVDFAEESFSW